MAADAGLVSDTAAGRPGTHNVLSVAAVETLPLNAATRQVYEAPATNIPDPGWKDNDEVTAL
jgi:hypothetical protein